MATPFYQKTDFKICGTDTFSAPINWVSNSFREEEPKLIKVYEINLDTTAYLNIYTLFVRAFYLSKLSFITSWFAFLFGIYNLIALTYGGALIHPYLSIGFVVMGLGIIATTLVASIE